MEIIVTYLAFNEVSDTGLGHDGNGHGFHNFLDHAGVGHARDTTLNADISGDTLEGHDGSSTGFFGDTGLVEESVSFIWLDSINSSSKRSYLLGVHDVHNNATLQHLGETGLDSEVIAGGSVWSSHCELAKIKIKKGIWTRVNRSE